MRNLSYLEKWFFHQYKMTLKDQVQDSKKAKGQWNQRGAICNGFCEEKRETTVGGGVILLR